MPTSYALSQAFISSDHAQCASEALGLQMLEQLFCFYVQGRIGPYTFEGVHVGPKRIWLPSQDLPGLSMTRALGDQLGASVGVSAEPEITQACCHFRFLRGRSDIELIAIPVANVSIAGA